ncbi:MAG: chromosome segregation protein SMC [Candidatus Eisenbacteria bacterium]|uniref:Chromosome segregation protein SMC n=1 Tax=Eiseniibacteriota bacterium TaxID=2212470 RepID=A0A538TI59_UNCEI|nr:MAG: chromosome segregation protein SMC [Candidatus Eisenbacteria bacterium]
MRFTNLHLENWRNFAKAEVALTQRVFVVGPNASGKSNLLDVFRFLHDIVAVGGGFQEAVRRRGGISKLRCLAARRFPNVAIKAEMGEDNGVDPRWTYEVHFTQDNRQRAIVMVEKVTRDGIPVLTRPNIADEKDPERLTQTFLEQVNVNRKFRPIVDYLRTVRYLHIVPQLVRDPDRSVGRQDDPYGGDFLEQIARTPAGVRAARLRKIQDALRLAVPQLRELKLSRDSRGTPHLQGRYVHWRPQGAWQSEDQFSDGTLRLLGLLWATLDGSGPLLLEEPEMSLHPDVVRFVPQLLARIQRRSSRQVFVSTHSTDLLQDTGIGLDEVLLLIPGNEGTSIRQAEKLKEIRELLKGGLSIAEAVLPWTRPARAEQLGIFGD